MCVCDFRLQRFRLRKTQQKLWGGDAKIEAEKEPQEHPCDIRAVLVGCRKISKGRFKSLDVVPHWAA